MNEINAFTLWEIIIQKSLKVLPPHYDLLLLKHSLFFSSTPILSVIFFKKSHMQSSYLQKFQYTETIYKTQGVSIYLYYKSCHCRVHQSNAT